MKGSVGKEERTLKILWVKAGGLYPPNVGGRIRSYNILKGLARRHSVTLFTFYAATPDDIHSQLECEFDRVVCVPLAIPSERTFRGALRYGRHLLGRRPYTVAKFCQAGVAPRLRQLIATSKPDVIVCDFVFAAETIPWNTPLPKVLFTHNVETSIWQQHYTLARNPLWKIMCWREYKTMQWFERCCINRADHVLTVSAQDQSVFSEMIDSSRITVIPTGVDVNYFRPSSEPPQPNTLVFSGAMDWLPNEDGVQYFVKQILPLIRKQMSNVSLCVVGRSPSRRLLALGADHPNVHVTGCVDDVRPYVQSASVYVVPLRIGGGTRLKIFEAMAMGKAIVSTSIGAEGLPVQPGIDIMIADKPEEFARATVHLLEDHNRREALGRAARELVVHGHSWEVVAQDFERVLEKCISVGKATAGKIELEAPTLSLSCDNPSGLRGPSVSLRFPNNNAL